MQEAIREFIQSKFGMQRPPMMRMAGRPNAENSYLGQAIDSYTQQINLNSSLVSSLVDIFE